jgi:hypothetical protein
MGACGTRAPFTRQKSLVRTQPRPLSWAAVNGTGPPVGSTMCRVWMATATSLSSSQAPLSRTARATGSTSPLRDDRGAAVRSGSLHLAVADLLQPVQGQGAHARRRGVLGQVSGRAARDQRYGGEPDDQRAEQLGHAGQRPGHLWVGHGRAEGAVEVQAEGDLVRPRRQPDCMLGQLAPAWVMAAAPGRTRARRPGQARRSGRGPGP